ncbi:MAG: ABC transporter permease [Chloroflexi bacterium]|nr:ABC transporter permease [Chloroflexota bacterium]
MAAKVGQYLLTIWIVLSLNFLLPRLMPGNPLAQLDNPQGLPMPLSEEQRTRLMAYYGLDKPLFQQYTDYLSGLARGELGWSISSNAPVLSVLVGRLRWTLLLVGTATVLYVLLGIALGSFSAWHRHSLADKFLLTVTSVAGSFPPFFLAMLLIIVFGVRLGMFPLGGAQSPFMLQAAPLARGLDIARHMVLPTLALVLTNVGEVYYLTRNAMVQTLGDTYIAVARSKGLRERRLLFGHALPNALLPIITLIALRFGALVMGAVMVEVAFAYPGVGSAIVEASVSRDYPLLQGAFALITVTIMGANLLADILHGVLDPRVRHAT